MQYTKRVLSGIRATGRLHVGNYFGAVRKFFAQQSPDSLNMYFVADWHTLTTQQDPEVLRQSVREVVKDYLAAGLDPEQSIIYVQSSVPETAELSLLLSMLQPLGELLRIPTFKEKVRDNPDNANLGFATYPVLMAADILGPQATTIPVGEDQVPNVELAQHTARRFNNIYGETFTIPQTLTEMNKVPGLSGGKMGKSESDDAIGLDMSKEEILKRYLRRGITDVKRKGPTDPGDPYNRCQSVYPFHEIVTEGETETREIANLCLAGQIGCVDCKHRLVDSIYKLLEPFQERRRELADKDDYIREILVEGGRKARAIIKPTVDIVRDKMGIVLY